MKKYSGPSAEITNISSKDIIQSSSSVVFEKFVGDVSASMPDFWEGYL